MGCVGRLNPCGPACYCTLFLILFISPINCHSFFFFFFLLFTFSVTTLLLSLFFIISSLIISSASYTLIHLLYYYYSLLLHIFLSLLTTTRFLFVYHVPSGKSKSCLFFGFDLPHHTFCIFKAFEWCGANCKDPCSCNMGSSCENSCATLCTFSLHLSPSQRRCPLPKSSMITLYLLWCSTIDLKYLIMQVLCSFPSFILTLKIVVVNYLCNPPRPLLPHPNYHILRWSCGVIPLVLSSLTNWCLSRWFRTSFLFFKNKKLIFKNLILLDCFLVFFKKKTKWNKVLFFIKQREVAFINF